MEDRLLHCVALPLAKVENMLLVSHLQRTRDRFGDLCKHGSRQVHQVSVVAVGLVELQHGELGVVLRGDPFVPEYPAELVDTWQTPDDQPFQVELQSDAQIEVHVQGIVVCAERARERSPRHRLQHRRLHFDVASSVEEAAYLLDDSAALHEDVTRFLVYDQVHVALAKPRLHVRESVPLLGQRKQVLGQMKELGRQDGQFVGAGSKESPFGSHDVPEIQELEEIETLIAQLVLSRIHLHTLLAVEEIHESRLAVRAQGHDPAAGPDKHILLFELLGGGGVIRPPDIGGSVRVVELVRIGIVPSPLQFLQLEPALG